ncbi:MAG: SLBB domain-containing protein [Candidatus Kapabacteria bacterium]|nr:SLBB domain-containing protein [Candidatus Kapabacteria bacterium]
MRSILFAITFLVIFLPSALFSQMQGITFPTKGVEKPGEYDTLGVKNLLEITKEVTNIQETPVDKNTYLVSPGDKLTFLVLTFPSRQFEIPVNPDGSIVIKDVGVISTNGKTLAEVEKEVMQRATKMYKTTEVSLSLSKLSEFKVSILGAVRTPAYVNATQAVRLSEIMVRAGGPLENASTRNILIKRENGTVLNVDLMKYYALGDKTHNPTMLGGDVIVVPFTDGKTNFIEINGEVANNKEKKYEFREGDKVSTIIRFAGGFTPKSLIDSVELVRLNYKTNETNIYVIDASAWKQETFYQPNATFPNDMNLILGDRIYVRAKSKYFELRYISLTGEVRFPGRYSIGPEERLLSILKRAGGVLPTASLETSFFVRHQEQPEDKELLRLQKKNSDLELTDAERQYLTVQNRSTKGQMAVNFARLLEKERIEDNVVLEHRDSIVILKRLDYVNVIGEVKNPGLQQYNSKLVFSDYLQLANGLTYQADEGQIQVVKSNGVRYEASDVEAYKIEAGDQIIIPGKIQTKFIDVVTVGLTILAQLLTISGFLITFSRL